jgi:hypothetical protein
MVCCRHLCADRYRQKGTETRRLALHLQVLPVSIFEKTEISCALQPDRHSPDQPAIHKQLNRFDT